MLGRQAIVGDEDRRTRQFRDASGDTAVADWRAEDKRSTVKVQDCPWAAVAARRSGAYHLRRNPPDIGAPETHAAWYEERSRGDA